MVRAREDVSADEEEKEAAETVRRKRRRPWRTLCWRCAMKKRRALKRYSRRRGAPRKGRHRPSLAFRALCESCARWRALDAQAQQRRGRTPFMPTHIRRAKDDAPLRGKDEAPPLCVPGGRRRRRRRGRAAPQEDFDAWYKRIAPPMTPVSEDAYRDKYNDPERHYTLWLQHEEERLKAEQEAAEKKGG